MAFVHGKNTEVFVDKYDLTSYFDSVSVNMNADLAETSTFGKSSKTYIAGLKDATMSLEGYYDSTAGAVDAVMNTIFGADDKLISVYLSGDAVASAGYAMNAIETAYAINPTLDSACRVSCAAQSDETSAERVISLHALGAETATWTGTAVNNSASSASGGSAYIHVTAATGTIEIKIQHSSDNFVADTTDLVSFTNVTGATSERKTFTGTVKQYTRGYATIAGGETITFQMGIHRA